jgi:hypothetical protein
MLKQAALLLAAPLSALSILAGSAVGHASGASCYTDAVGDAGDAPDITRVTINPQATTLTIDVSLAQPTELGPYGWILIGFDTDRNPFTGGGRGDDLLTITDGNGTTLSRWVDGRFTRDFPHHRYETTFSGTDLTLTIARADLQAQSFDFAVASLRQQADLAPGGGVARYPKPPSGRCEQAKLTGHSSHPPASLEGPAQHVGTRKEIT